MAITCDAAYLSCFTNSKGVFSSGLTEWVPSQNLRQLVQLHKVVVLANPFGKKNAIVFRVCAS